MKLNGHLLTEYEEQRYHKIKALQQQAYDVYGQKWERNFDSLKIKNMFTAYDKATLEQLVAENKIEVISIAGRLMQKRIMGKVFFANFQDQMGTFQIFSKQSDNSTLFAFFNDYADLGDFFGIKGTIMKTKTGELTIKVTELVLLAKAIQMLPDKYQGLNDIEQRYRKRYVDLIANPEIKTVFLKRAQILSSLREFLNTHHFLEVETPILQTISGGASAKPFITHHNTLKTDFYLRIATELHLKRLIVGGFEKVYEIGRLFRNEGMSPKHNPEFTTIEIYAAYQDMQYVLKLTEDCIQHIMQAVNNSLDLTYDGHELHFAGTWKQITMIESIKQATGVDFTLLVASYATEQDIIKYNSLKAAAYTTAVEMAKAKNVFVPKHCDSIGHIINLFFEAFVEKTLIQPTFITEYPVEISPLAKLMPGSKEFVQRFELFIAGREYANGYSELNDPVQQYERFLEQIIEKNKGNDEASDLDYDFVQALEYGMPPTGGVGIGLDRLIMLMTKQNNIKDVLLFPHLKPEKLIAAEVKVK